MLNRRSFSLAAAIAFSASWAGTRGARAKNAITDIVAAGHVAMSAGRYDEALRLWLSAAESGDPECEFYVGLLYESGLGTAGDQAKTMNWYRKSAKHGYAPAQSNLGVKYALGDGIPQDEVQAVYWYRQAAEQGLALAQVNLGFMYHSGAGVAQDYGKEVFWNRKAADQGSSLGRGNLGLNYAHGRGVDQDYVQAYAWLSLALVAADEENACGGEMMHSGAALVHRVVEQERASIAHSMTEREIARAEAIAKAWKPLAARV